MFFPRASSPGWAETAGGRSSSLAMVAEDLSEKMKEGSFCQIWVTRRTSHGWKLALWVREQHSIEIKGIGRESERMVSSILPCGS